MAPTQAILFDIDGTLVDSVYLHVDAWRRAFAGQGLVAPAWEIHRRIGKDGSLLVEELIDVAGEIQERSRAFAALRDWSEHIDREKERIRLEQERKRKGTGEAEERAEAVRIMTLHGAKGLEFDTVFLPDLNEGILPYHRSGREADIEEERRLFYVGMTRAKEHLYLTWTRHRFGKEMRPSRFLAPLI